MEDHAEHHALPRINNLTILVLEINETIEIETQEQKTQTITPQKKNNN
jgi:hypothetical protein